MSNRLEEAQEAYDRVDRTIRRKLNNNGDYPTKEEFVKRETLRQEVRKLSITKLDTKKDLLASAQALYEQEKRHGNTETKDRAVGEGESDGAKSK